MGWTSYRVEPTYKNGKVFIDRKAECDSHFDKDKCKILKSAMVGSTYYAAVAVENEVIAAVTLTRVDNKEYCNFAYKPMDETMGPCEDNCPKGILDLLTPTDSEYANDWRKRCYESLKKKRDPNALGNLPIGSVIKYRGYDGKERTLIKCDAAYQFKRPWWKVVGENKYVPAKHIPNDYEVIKKGE